MVGQLCGASVEFKLEVFFQFGVVLFLISCYEKMTFRSAYTLHAAYFKRADDVYRAAAPPPAGRRGPKEF